MADFYAARREIIPPLLWSAFPPPFSAPVQSCSTSSWQITALDLDAPENRWTFDVVGAPGVYATGSGESVLAVQSDDDRVAFLESGIALEGHGDHRNIKISEPVRIDGQLTGPRPFHAVTHHGTSAINFDRGGYALFLTEDEIVAGDFEGERFEQDLAHHGFSLPH